MITPSEKDSEFSPEDYSSQLDITDDQAIKISTELFLVGDLKTANSFQLAELVRVFESHIGISLKHKDNRLALIQEFLEWQSLAHRIMN